MTRLRGDLQRLINNIPRIYGKGNNSNSVRFYFWTLTESSSHLKKRGRRARFCRKREGHHTSQYHFVLMWIHKRRNISEETAYISPAQCPTIVPQCVWITSVNSSVVQVPELTQLGSWLYQTQLWPEEKNTVIYNDHEKTKYKSGCSVIENSQKNSANIVTNYINFKYDIVRIWLVSAKRERSFTSENLTVSLSKVNNLLASRKWKLTLRRFRCILGRWFLIDLSLIYNLSRILEVVKETNKRREKNRVLFSFPIAWKKGMGRGEEREKCNWAPYLPISYYFRE